MFWVRVDAIRPVLEIEWKYGMFPHEENQRDGLLHHAIERTIGAIALCRGFETSNFVSQIERFIQHQRKN
jgi:lipopolysaccharide biosynthesis protein